MPARRSRGPIGNHVLCVRICETVGSLIVREIRDDDERILHSHPSPPNNYALIVIEICLNEFSIIDPECGMTSAQVDQTRHIFKNCVPHWILQAREVDRVYLLATRIAHITVRIEQVILVGKLFPGEKHRYSICGE